MTHEPDAPTGGGQRSRPPRSPRLTWTLALVGGWLVVSLLVLGGLLLFAGNDKSTDSSHSAVTASSSASASTLPLPAGWVEQARDTQTDCAGHAYGQVQTFLKTNACTQVDRLLATFVSSGRPVVVAANVIRFPTAQLAAQYLALVNADGTGNISDLLREGHTYPGGPPKLPTAAFASRADNTAVHVAEAAYATGASSATDATLKAAATQVANGN
jgi:hypothetical protein